MTTCPFREPRGPPSAASKPANFPVTVPTLFYTDQLGRIFQKKEIFFVCGTSSLDYGAKIGNFDHADSPFLVGTANIWLPK